METTVPIRVQFDQPVVEPDDVGQPIERELFVISPRISGRYRFSSVDELEFRPDAPFQSATRYRVSIRPEVVGPGRTLTGDRRFRFHTPLFALVGSSWSERRGQAQVSLRFSHPVDPVEVAEAALFETEAGLYVAAERITRRPGRRVVLRLPFSLEEARRRGVRLSVDGALQALTGGEPLSKTVVRAIPPPGEEAELRIVEIGAGQKGVQPSIEIETSEPVDPQAIAAHLELEPQVESKSVVDTGHGALILGDLRTGATYRVRVTPGLTGRDGGELFDPVEAEVELPVMEPGVGFVDRSRFPTLPADGAIRVQTRGVRRAQLVVQPVAEVNAVHMLDVLERGVPLPSSTLVGSPQTIEWVVDDPEGVVEEVRHLPPVPGAHVLKVSLRDADRPWVRIDRWVLARGLRMVVKRTADTLWAFVVDTEQGRPASGARVRVRSESNQVMGERRTDEAGVAEIALGDGVPVLVSVDQDSSFAFLSMRGSRLVVPPASAAGETGGLVTDRAVVAPGERVRTLAFVPASRRSDPMRLVWSRPEGGALGARSAEVDRSGWAEGEAIAPRRLDLDSIRLTVESADRAHMGTARLKLQAAFHRGFDVRVSPGPAEGQGPGFVVRAPEAASLEARCRYVPRTVEGPGRSRARGAFEPFDGPRRPVGEDTVTCPIPDGVRGPAWVELQVEATDPIGRRARRVVRVPFSRDRELIAFAVEPDDRPEVSVTVLDDGGRALSNRSVAFRWSRLVATTALVWDESAGLVREGVRREIPLADGRLSTGAEPVEVPFEPPSPGRYRLVVDSGAVRGERVVTVGADDPLLQVDVTPERPAAGQALRVRVRADRPGWALVSLEQDRVLAHRWVEVRDGRADVELAVPAETGPRAHVVVAHAGRATIEEIVVDAGPAPPRVEVRPFGTRDGRLRYLVKVEPRPLGVASVILAPGSGAGLRSARLAWQRRGALRVATHGLDPASVQRVPEVGTSTGGATVVPRWHRAAVGPDGWGAFEVERPIPAGRATYILRTGDRLHSGALAIDAHPDPWLVLRGPRTLQIGDAAPLDWAGSAPAAPTWVGADDGTLRAESPGPLTVTARRPGTSADWSVSVRARPARFDANVAWAGYERPGVFDLAGGARAWAWVGPQPIWQGTGTLLALGARPPDLPTLAAAALIEVALGDGMAEVVRTAAARAPVDAAARIAALRAAMDHAPPGAPDPWTALAAAAAFDAAADAGLEAARGAARPAFGRVTEGPAVGVARAWSGADVAEDAVAADPLAVLLVGALRAPTTVPLERVLSAPERHPAREALRLWALQRAHFAQSPRPYWGSLALDGDVVRRFNDQRATTVELEPPGRVTIETTGSGRAYVGLAAERAPDDADGGASELRVALEPLVARPGGLRVGDAAWITAVVDRPGPWSTELRLPSGLVLEARSGWDATTLDGPPEIPPARVRYDASARALMATQPEGGAATLRAVVRAAWPGRFGGPSAVIANPTDLRHDRLVEGAPVRITTSP